MRKNIKNKPENPLFLMTAHINALLCTIYGTHLGARLRKFNALIQLLAAAPTKTTGATSKQVQMSAVQQ